MEMTEMPKSNADDDGERGKLETTTEEETPLLGDHDGPRVSTQVPEFTTTDERECPLLSRSGELSTGRKI